MAPTAMTEFQELRSSGPGSRSRSRERRIFNDIQRQCANFSNITLMTLMYVLISFGEIRFGRAIVGVQTTDV